MFYRKLVLAIVTASILTGCNTGPSIKGNIILEAYREGTQAQDILYLNNLGEYEIHSTGAFFYSQRTIGKYKKKADTLFLHEASKNSRLLRDTILIKGNLLYLVQNDSSFLSLYRILE